MNKKTEQLTDELLRNMEIPFGVTREEAWKSILDKTGDKLPETQKKSRSLAFKWQAQAASLALIIGTSLFLIFFQKSTYSGNEEVAVTLPDGSKVIVEEDSRLAWSPITWKFNRKLNLDGTAYFDVVKGNTFTIISDKASTQVLGTTFRIEAEKDSYKVSCFTGKVKVTDRESSISAILLANERAEINEKGEFSVTIIKEEETVSKPENLFFTFRNKKITEVFADLEAHFNVEIVTTQSLDLYFSGNLKVGSSFEEILSAVCLPLDLKYEKVSDKKYLVMPSKDS